MNDPKRLLDDLGTGSDASSLLRALRPAEPPSLEKQAELVQRMMTPAVAPMPAAGVRVKTWVGAGVAVLACGLAATWLLSPGEPAPPVRPRLAPATIPSLAPPSRQPEPLPAPTVRERVSAVDAPPSAAVSGKPAARDTLAEEEALLEQARRALASSPGAALALLRQHQQRFPAGQLTAERMFLSVDALRRAGDRAGAERQTQALLKRFPSSVYAGQLRNQAAP
jgi:hypothetical protein